MVRVVIDVPDASHLQLLADALAEAATMRTRAAGVAARQVIEDPAIADKRSDAAKLLHVVADADWIRTVAEQLPALVLTDAAPPAPAAPPPAGPAPGQPAAAPPHPSLAPSFQAPAARGHQFDLPADQQEALRRLTVPPGARLLPGMVVAEEPGPPQAAADAQAALESIAGGGDDDAEIFG